MSKKIEGWYTCNAMLDENKNWSVYIEEEDGDGDPHSVATVCIDSWCWLDKEKMVLRANIIAAAPELLEALEMFMDMNLPNAMGNEAIFENGAKAIKKANGELKS